MVSSVQVVKPHATQAVVKLEVLHLECLLLYWSYTGSSRLKWVWFWEWPTIFRTHFARFGITFLIILDPCIHEHYQFKPSDHQCPVDVGYTVDVGTSLH